MSEKLIGIIKLPPKLNGKIQKPIKLIGHLQYSSYVINDAEIYDGDYVVTPLPFQQQELQTKDKILEENVTVKEMLY